MTGRYFMKFINSLSSATSCDQNEITYGKVKLGTNKKIPE